MKYSNSSRELLAICLSIKHFRHFLEGHEFYIFTDHKPLTHALICLTHALPASPSRYSPRETRHLDCISQFTSDIRHVQGTRNPFADALSRIELSALHHSSPLDFETLAQAQRDDPKLLSSTNVSSLLLQDVSLHFSSGTILCDVSTANPLPYVPPSYRRRVFDSLHSLSHPGNRATQHLIRDRFVWPGINKDVREWARTRPKCHTAKVHRHVAAPLGTFFSPEARFDHLHIYIVGPLPPPNGFRYLFTVIDRFTRWLTAVPIPDMQAETVARTFITHWISSFGVPSTVTTDGGAQFESALFSNLTARLGIHRSRTTAYHPTSNGMGERFHSQLKNSLKASPDANRWTEHLPIILLGIRNTVKVDLNCTPAQLVYGTTLRLPGQFFSSSSTTPDLAPDSYADRLQSAMLTLKPVSPRQNSIVPRVPKDLHTCTHVYVRTDAVRKRLQPPYTGPYKILRRHARHFMIDISGKSASISIDRLKVAYLDDDLLRPSPDTIRPTHSPRNELPTPPTPARTTKSGRRVHFPDRFASDRFDGHNP